MFLLNSEIIHFFSQPLKKNQQLWLASQYFLLAKSHFFQKLCFKKNSQRKPSAPTAGGPLGGVGENLNQPNVSQRIISLSVGVGPR